MSADYDYSLSGVAVRSLLSVSKPLRSKAEQFLNTLAVHPFRAPEFNEIGPSGRHYSVFIELDIIITLWVDHASKELRVIRIEFV